MSLTPDALPAAARDVRLPLRVLMIAALAIAAVVVVALLLAGLVALLMPAPPPLPTARHPFGMGASAPASQPGLLTLWFPDFYQRLTAALRAARTGGILDGGLITISFAYGVFHAAGPGHGKAVIAGYVVASERALRRAVGLSFAAALLQALVAIVLVGIFSVLLGATAKRMEAATWWVEMASFAAVAVVGAMLLWRKARRLVALQSPALATPAAGHWHLPAAEALPAAGNWRETLAVAFAAGARPCSGAIIVLVFALSQQIFATGVAAVLAMALGTAATTSLIAAVAVYAKRLAVRFASGDGRRGLITGAMLEVLAAAFVFVAGLGLMTGYWFVSGPS